MEHLFIVNPRSIKNDSAIRRLEKDLSDCVPDGDSCDICLSRYPRDAVGIVNKYASRFRDGIRIYAVGGDGVLFDCLNGMIDYPNAELAAVPYGRTNDFARAVSNGNADKLLSVKSLLTAPSVSIDIVRCGSNYYINFCSVGVESYSVNKWYKTQERLFNTRNMLFINCITATSGIMSLFDKNVANQYYNVVIDGEKYDGNYASISFSNGPFCGGSWSIAPEAVLNDGEIDVIMVKSASPFRLLPFMPGYLTGKYSKFPEYISHIRAKEISIRSNRPMFANLDGEYFLDTSLSLKILPRAVKIIAAGESSYILDGDLS